MRTLRSTLPRLDNVWDIVALTKNRRVTHLVLHGHQFDRVSNPRMAPRFGETISECLGIWFQGADRHWKFEEDGPQNWLDGSFDFNYLVEDGIAWDEPGMVAQNLIEQVCKHNIAWEYFSHKDPVEALAEEVFKGKRLFKYRHMDERKIRDGVETQFPRDDQRPHLVLGHSHEPRFNSAVVHPHGKTGSVDWYFNSGSAGRFAGLLWAIEIVDGVESLVSWSTGERRPRKTRWTPMEVGSPKLVPSMVL